MLSKANDLDDLQQQARIELLAMDGCKVLPDPIATHKIKVSAHLASCEVLNRYNPAIIEKYTPQNIAGDGNCLYRSVSFALFGTPQFYLQLRLRAAIEVILHPECYDSSNAQCKMTYLHDYRVLTDTHVKTCVAMLSCGVYSDIIHILGLSSVIHYQITMYYPPIGKSDYFAIAPFNQCVRGRGVNLSDKIIYIMWTTMSYQRENTVINHFVPLIPIPVRNIHDAPYAKFPSTSKPYPSPDDDLPYNQISMRNSKERKGSKRRISHSKSGSGSDITVEYGVQQDNSSHVEELSSPLCNGDSVVDTCCEIGGIHSSAPVLREHDFDSNHKSKSRKRLITCNDDSNDSIQLTEKMDDSAHNDCFEAGFLNSPLPSANTTFKAKQRKIFLSSTPNVSANNSINNSDTDSSKLTDSKSVIEASSNQTVVNSIINGKFLSLEQLLPKLLNPSTSIYPNIPRGTKSNVFFVVQNEENSKRFKEGKRNVFWDDCGIWKSKCGGTTRSVFIRANNHFKFIKFQTRKDDPLITFPESTHIILARKYYTLKSKCDYKKRISWIDNGNESTPPIYLAEYIGVPPRNHDSHGNNVDKSNRYVRSSEKVMAGIRKMADTHSTKEIYNTLSYDCSFGGPRNTKQVKNIQYQARRKDNNSTNNANIADHILQVITMIQDHEYVQQLIHTKGRPPSIILYTKEQLVHMLCALSQPNDSTILGFDRTFNLGPCYATVAVYKCSTVARVDMHNNPIFLGPIYLHWDGLYETYYSFFTHLALHFSNASTELKLDTFITGTDEEKAIMKAIKVCFPNSRHALCIRHLCKNAEDYMTNKIGITKADRKVILSSLFKEGGVAFSNDSLTFDTRVKNLRTMLQTKYPLAENYLCDRLVPLIANHTCFTELKSATLSLWTNNNCESMNHVLKSAINWKPQQLPQLICKLYDVVKCQFVDLQKCLYGQGNFKLDKRLCHLLVDPNEWVNKSNSDKQKLYEKLLKARLKQQNFTFSTDGTIKVPIMKHAGKKPNQRRRRRSERITH